MMKPVPHGAFEVAVARAAGAAPSGGVLEVSPEDSEPPHAARPHTAPTRTAALKPRRLKIFVPMVGGLMLLMRT